MNGFFLFVAIIGYQSFTHCAINCKNPLGKAVDWFILYKLPKLSLLLDGTKFVYMDAKTTKFQFEPSRNIAKESANPLFRTLKPLYTNSRRVQSYAMYNDQPPPNKTAAQNKAHSKGALAFDKKTGFWMISSIPHFPAKVSDGYRFLDEQKRYGQIVLCVTVSLSVKEKIENIFSTTNPYIYDMSNFTVKGGNPTNESITDLKTSGDNLLMVFAKSATFGKDIYSDLIQPVLNDEIYVQTWHPNTANIGKVMDIHHVDFGKLGSKNLAFNTSLDHSKWAVATTQPFTCIGDINRKETQFKRGGLSVCLKDEKVAKEFRNLYTTKIKESTLISPKNTCPEKKEFLKAEISKLKQDSRKIIPNSV